MTEEELRRKYLSMEEIALLKEIRKEKECLSLPRVF